MRPAVSSGFRAAQLAVIVYILLYIYTSAQHALFLSLCHVYLLPLSWFSAAGHLSFCWAFVCLPRSAVLMFALGIFDKISIGTCSSAHTISCLLLSLFVSLAWGTYNSHLNSIKRRRFLAWRTSDSSFFIQQNLLKRKRRLAVSLSGPSRQTRAPQQSPCLPKQVCILERNPRGD